MSPLGAASSFLRPPPAFPGMRIGLLGGSFNPAHRGHLHISKAALKRLRLDRIWWLVSPGNPLKPAGGIAPLAARVATAEGLARDPRIVVTGFEAALPDGYTITTLRFVTRRHPATSFVWLMGADCLATFHRWREWEEIFTILPIAVLDRPGYRHAALGSVAARCFAQAQVDESDAAGLPLLPPPAWTFLSLPLSRLSSTKIREKG